MAPTTYDPNLNLPLFPPALPPHAVHHDVNFGAAIAAGMAPAEVAPAPAPPPGDDEQEEAAAAAATPVEIKRTRKVPLTFHEALTFAPRGIYYDFATNQLRCSCNHKTCEGWASYAFTRHFGLQCHKKYEEERLDEYERVRLKEARETYIRMNPVVLEETNPLRRRRKKKKTDEEKEKPLTVTEKRVQEKHWMAMWKDAKNELRQLRQDLKEEVDPEVRAELVQDIDGLKRRKEEWARMLGLNV